jgi:hypothetical protein
MSEILQPGARAPEFNAPATPCFFANGERHDGSYDARRPSSVGQAARSYDSNHIVRSRS